MTDTSPDRYELYRVVTDMKFAGEPFDKPAALPQAEPPLVQMARA